MKKTLLSLLIYTFVFIFPSTTNAITIGFSPVSQTVAVLDQVNIDLVVSGLGAGSAPSIGAYDFDILFDSSILAFNTAVFGNQVDMAGWGIIGLDKDFGVTAPGVLDIWELSWDTEADLNNFQADSFTIATLTFDTLIAGTSSLSIDNSYDLFDASGALWLTATLESGSISVTSANPVPEPSTLLLLGAGLMGVRFLKRKGVCG